MSSIWLFCLLATSLFHQCQAGCRAPAISDIVSRKPPTCNQCSFPTYNSFYRLPAERIWDVVATTRFTQPLEDTAPAAFVAYLSRTNPWSQSMRELLSCLPRFFRREDCIFMEVYFEEMTYTEQMHHRLGALPAFKVYTMGRRYTLEGQQSFGSLVAFISAKTGARPVLGPAAFKEAVNSTSLPCSTKLSPVTAGDFGQAGRNCWLVLSAGVVIVTAVHHGRKRRRRQEPPAA